MVPLDCLEARDASHLESSRLGVLISTLQSAEYLLETAATRIAGDHGGWAVVTLLEFWRATCRLRLLRLQPRQPEQLLQSVFVEEASNGERWANVASRIGASSPLRHRASLLAGEGSSNTDPNRSQVQENWLSKHTVGELLHILQPLAYLLMLLVVRVHARAPHSSRRLGGWQALAVRMPWLTALSIELVALRLCSRSCAPSGPDATPQHAYPLNGQCNGRAAATKVDVAPEVTEFAHRQKLALLFLLRPAARTITRSLLVHISKSSPEGSTTQNWSMLTLELIDSLDASCAFRYFRTVSPAPPPPPGTI